MDKLITVRVKPGSKKGDTVQTSLDNELLIYVRQPAIDGRANQAVRDLLADFYDVSKTSVQLVSGKTSRIKRYRILTGN